MKRLIALNWAGKFCAVVLWIGAAQCATAQSGTFITFDVPGALGTEAEGINSSGTVAGVYFDAQYTSHGFIRDAAGNITAIDEPDAAQGGYGTTVFAINDAGEVAGWYAPISNPLVFQGFIRDAQGNFTPVGVPQFETTMVYALSNSGALAGCAQQTDYCSDDGGGTNEGFVRQASGAIIPFVPANATNVTPRAMNSKNAVTGSYSDSKNEIHGFVMTAGGTITEFSLPQFQGTGVGTFPRGINDSNVITGIYYDPKLIARGFIRQPNGKATTINVPGPGVRTYPVAINAGGRSPALIPTRRGTPTPSFVTRSVTSPRSAPLNPVVSEPARSPSIIPAWSRVATMIRRQCLMGSCACRRTRV
jgi:uncharacterized membrane protein